MMIGAGLVLPSNPVFSLINQIYALFAGGQNGAWYDPSEAIISPWYQASAGTIPVTAVGQNVGFMRDKSGRGNHALQVTETSKPALQIDGNGKYSSIFSGIDTLSSATGGGSTSGFFWCGAVNIAAAPVGSIGLFNDIGISSGYLIRINPALTVSLFAGTGTVYASATTGNSLVVGAVALITVWDDGINLCVQIDSGAIAQIARPVVAAGSAGFRIGTAFGGEFFQGNIYSFIYRTGIPVTASERANIQSYCRQQAGL